MIPPGFQNREEEYGAFLRTICIGIFGYFSQSRIDELKRVKECLIKRGFNVKMSIDLAETYIQRPNETDANYSLRLSEALYESSDVYIFILIPPNGPEVRILDSVGMEYGWCYRDRKPYVAILIKRGYDLATLPQGALDSMQKTWTIHSYGNIEEVFAAVIKYCESAIREMHNWSDT